MSGRRRPVAQKSRTGLAAALVAGVIGSLLLGWYFAGSAEVRARAQAARQRPVAQAEAHAEQVAAELRRDLEDVLQRESQRPYYHYGNLFRDPRSTSAGLSLSPSPLATGPSEALVAEHFQIDARGAVTVPTINDDEPSLSNRDRLAWHVTARAQLAAAQGALRERVLGAGPAVAMAEGVATQAPDEPSRPAPVRRKPPVPASNRGFEQNASQAAVSEELLAQASNVEGPALGQDAQAAQDPGPQVPPDKSTLGQATEEPSQAGPKTKPSPQRAVKRVKLSPKIEQLDAEVYAQNQAPTQVYQTIVAQKRQQAVQAPAPAPVVSKGPVTIVSSPLAWHAVELAAKPELMAMRQVLTPDGTLVQGLLIDRQALARWLEDRAERATLEPSVAALSLVASGTGGSAEVIAPWAVAAQADASALAAAGAAALALERGFLWRFAGVAAGSLAAGAMLLWLMIGAERLARERSQFAAAAAHELRTPLAGLQLYGEMLADGLGDPSKARDYARRLSEEAARLGRVVANVLGFSQLERGNLALAPAEADLAGVLRELVSRTEPALERQGAFLELVVPAALPARFDRDAVLRIVGNLLDNAEKYGRGAEDRTITLSAMALPGASAVEVIVTDRGPGVEQELGRRLFRPFSRARAADHPAGLGLGLALSRSLAEAMGGALTYRRRGAETEFVLRLPA